MVKRVQLSADDSAYYTLPGNSGELRNEAGQLVDTIFGQQFASSQPGLIGWTLNSNALYKGFAGYVVKLMKGDTPVTMTNEAMSLVTGKTYQITAAAHQIIDLGTTIVVKDNAVDHTADVLSIDFLTGKVTFKAAYTPVGPITITGKYVPLIAIGGAKSFTLTQTAASLDDTDIPTAKANNGYRTFDPSGALLTVTLELGGVYKIANGFVAALQSRNPVYVLINPDNSDLSVAKGLFKYTGQGQSGDVGALEEETVNLALSVPQDIGAIALVTPFTWVHSGLTTLSMAVQLALTAWQNGTGIYVKYLPDGTNGFKGAAVVTDISLSGGLEAMNTFTVNLQGDGATTAVP